MKIKLRKGRDFYAKTKLKRIFHAKEQEVKIKSRKGRYFHAKTQRKRIKVYGIRQEIWEMILNYLILLFKGCGECL